MALEKRLKKTKTILAPNSSIPPMPQSNLNNVSHELRPHQIELRLQNVELLATQEKLLNSRHRENNSWKGIQERGNAVEEDTSGKPPRFVDVLTDHTQHKFFAEKSFESEQRFRTIAEFSPTGICVTDKKGNCTYVNKCWRKMCGLTEEEAKSHDWYKMVHPYDHQRVFDAWQKMIKFGGNFAIDCRITTPARQTTWVYGVATSLRDAREKLVGYVVIITDISLKKQTEIELQTSFSKLEKLVRNQNLVLQESNKNLQKEIKARARIEQDLLKSEAQLNEEKLKLEETNIALRVLLKNRDEEKKHIEEQMLLNVTQLSQPLLETIKKDPLTPRQTINLDDLAANLSRITSPFLRNISSLSLRLSPREIKVAHLVKEGQTSKEIAAHLNLAIDTVNIHRKSIRKKCGINGKKQNLRSMLMSFEKQ